MAADVLARHMRQRGRDVFFLTGTDEHGEPIETAAEREGVTPQELVDRNAAKFEELMPIIDATNDFFIRTSDPRHTDRVAEIIQRVYDNGWVDKGVYEGWYCPRCADFKTERELGPGRPARSTRSSSSASARRTGSSASRHSRGSSKASTRSAPTSSSPTFAATRRSRSSSRGSRMSRSRGRS